MMYINHHIRWLKEWSYSYSYIRLMKHHWLIHYSTNLKDSSYSATPTTFVVTPEEFILTPSISLIPPQNSRCSFLTLGYMSYKYIILFPFKFHLPPVFIQILFYIIHFFFCLHAALVDIYSIIGYFVNYY